MFLKVYILRETLVVHPFAIGVHPPTLHIHPLGIDIAAASIGLVSIYIGLVDGRANLIFAPEKTREYSAFSLTKRALFSIVF